MAINSKEARAEVEKLAIDCTVIDGELSLTEARDLGLYDLVLDGYGYRNLIPREMWDQQVQTEYKFNGMYGSYDLPRKILIAQVNGKAIGSLVIQPLPSPKRFWYLHGIVVDERFRGYSVAGKLMKQFAADTAVDALIGITNNPSAVVARVKSWPDHHVWWSGYPITVPGGDYSLTNEIVDSYQKVSEQKCDEDGLTMVPTSYLRPLVQTGIVHEHPIIELVTNNLHAAQRKSNGMSAAALLVSVKK